MQHRLTIDNDLLASHNLVEELDKLLSPFGINLEIENEEHDGFDVCIVTLPEEVTDGVSLIAAERNRQVNEEGWTDEHDDQHVNESLSVAAACYALPANLRFTIMHLWPWDRKWWKPSPDRIRDLTKAGALIAAEIDRGLRLLTKKD